MKDHQGISADTWRRLLDASHTVRDNAWAPYSEFHVGAAPPGHPEEVGLHSSKWAPLPEPTLRIGTTALTRAVLDLLGAK